MTTLSIALGDYPHIRPLLDGTEPVSGVDLQPVEVKPIISAYRQMIRDLEFDVCELAPVSYLMAREAGVPLTAIPAFINRRFHHADIQCGPDSGVTVPRDLEGKRMGVRAYSVSTGVWGRGLLDEEYGVDISSINWVVDDDDHVAGHVPDNVERITDGRSLGDLLATGEIAAAFGGNAGTGRAGAPRDGWTDQTASAPAATAEPYPLFENADEIAHDSYLRTGIYPLHSLIVLKQSLVDANPELPTALFEAFSRSKSTYLGTDPGWASQPRLQKQARQVDGDPIPYGVEPNKASIEAMIRYSASQGLIDGIEIDDLFAPGDYSPAL